MRKKFFFLIKIAMNDRKFLSHFEWEYLIIDEGHRIKNMNCRLIRYDF